jgi:uncharacterized protein YgiB involved in biofilm formation
MTMLCGMGASLAIPALAMAQPDANDRVSATEKGSLCYFSKVEIRWAGQSPNGLLQDTFLSLTNDNNADVDVQMYFVNGDPPLDAVYDGGGQLIERAHPGWNWLDNAMTLTDNQPVYWSALTGQPAAGGLSPFTALDPGNPPGRPAPDGSGERVLRGFVVAWAVDSDGEEIRWNHLCGNGTIVNYYLGAAWEYNSWNYACVADVAEGDATDGNPGELRMDGLEYDQNFDLLVLNFQAAGSTAFSGPRQVMQDADITLHPPAADLRQATTGPVTTKASYTVWNENEVKFTNMHRCVTCWDQALASQYADTPNHLLRANLQTDHGKAVIDGHAAFQCDVLDDPDTPEDESVTSIFAPLLGVAARYMSFDAGAAYARSGYNMIGKGTDDTAVIQYDACCGSQEGGDGSAPEALPQDASPRDILNWLEKQARVSTRQAGFGSN